MLQEENAHGSGGTGNGFAHLFKDEDRPSVKSRWSRSTMLLLLTCLVTLLSLLSNAVTFSRSWDAVKGTNTHKLDVSKLRRPSLYLGLERVPAIKLRNGDVHKPVSAPIGLPQNPSSGWPTAVARVNSAHPYFVFPQDGWVFLTEQVCTRAVSNASRDYLTCHVGSLDYRVSCYT